MLFTAPIFLFAFLPITLIGFFVLGRMGLGTLSVGWLLLASMIFYAWWSPWFLLFLIGSALLNFLAGNLIAASEGRVRKLVLGLAVTANLLALGWFKYVDFLIFNVNAIGGLSWPMLNIILPLGISFFTFQKIAWLIDIARGEAKPTRLIDFMLFVFFFPQLIAGPIVHHAELIPQIQSLARQERFKLDGERLNDLAVGFTLLLIGLVKKLVLADQVALVTSPVYEDVARGTVPGLVASWRAALGYTAQLYFDFSGYCDMAIGLARLFGMRLPANFDSPYQSTSIIEFWRRWHMTLSRFLRDYLYVPLGGNRKGPIRRYINLGLVMLLGGLWHGAGWTFVIWGGLHGTYLVIAHLWREKVRLAIPPILGWALTMLAVIVAWVFFRAPDVATAVSIVKGMFGLNGLWTAMAPRLDRPDGIYLALALLALAVSMPNSQQIMRLFNPIWGPIRPVSFAWQERIVWHPAKATAILAGLGITAALLFSWSTSEFLYFQF